MQFHNTIYILILLLILSIEDLLYLEIDIITFAIFILIILLNITHYNSLLITTIITHIIYLKQKNKIAYADIIIINALSTQLPITDIGIFFIQISLISLTYQYFTKKTKIPLIPFISISFTLNYFNIFNFTNLPF